MKKDDCDDDLCVDTPHFRMRANARWMLAAAGGFVACVLTVVGSIIWLRSSPPHETPIADRNGWSAEAFEDESTAQIVGSLPEFQIVGDNGEVIVQDNSKANVRLWDAVIAVNGQHLPNVPQQVGDCVSWAYCHGAEFLICIEMKTGPPGLEFHRLFPPYTYGLSRVQIGRGKIRGDGSCMAWAVAAGRDFGVLRSDADGVPAYSGTIARQWGKEGPPRDLIEAAKMYRIGDSSPVRSADAVRDAICNLYPVPFGAGRIGFDRVAVKYGRLVASPPQGSWAHAQCVIGYDGSGAEPLFCVLNSWGPLAAGKSPLQGEPPGSYWITEKEMDFIARQGDAFAISGFAGFKARKIDFKLTERVNPKPHRKEPGHVSVALGL